MAQTKLQILHALGSMDPGGVETWLLHVLKYIDRDRIQLHICTFGPQPGLYASKVEELGGKMLRCPKGANLWSFRRRFRRILREGNYHVVHSHVHLFSGALLRWARAEGVPNRIAHSHTAQVANGDTLARHYYRRLMKSWIDRYATHGLAASRLAAAQLFGEKWETDCRFRVLHCGIDLYPFQESIDQEEIRRELGIPVEALVVGHVGRFDAPKNQRFLLEIAREVLKRRADVHFLLVGDGPLRVEIEDRAREMGLSGRTHFVGIRTDVPRLMRGAMDVFVFPSLWEGLPVTVVEAQAAGLRCILSDAITGEVSILPEQTYRLPLSKGAEEWAVKTIDTLERGKIVSESAVRAVAETDFCMQRSGLSELYLRAME
jgi:glycosyltransferase involved in cell wall biosynthesis